jgi:hypothetical protein
MSRVPREQMLIVLGHRWAGDPATLAQGKAALNAMLQQCGVVHYATLFLMPPDQEAGDGDAPTLALELVIEEGLRPADAMRQLVAHGTDALWQLFEACPAVTRGRAVPSAAIAATERSTLLLDFLTQQVHVADGGHVGARDRSVPCIHNEAALLDWARRQHKPEPGDTETSMAARLRHQLRIDPQWRWAFVPERRSVWRASGGKNKLRLYCMAFSLWLSAFVMAWLAEWALGAIRAWASRPAWLQVWVEPELGTVAWLGASVARWVVGLLMVALAVKLAVMLLRSVVQRIQPLRAWLRRVWSRRKQPMDSPAATAAGVTLSAWIIAVLVIGMVMPLMHALDALWLPLLSLLGLEHLAAHQGAWWLRFALILATMLVVAISLLTSLLGFTLLARALKGPQAWHAMQPLPVLGAHQIHQQVEDCELALITKTMHMISLTELRRPRWWFAFWLRLGLSLVSWLSRLFNAHGRLGKASGIHFAHWHLIDGRRLVFCSNYDGTFGGYLDAFILGAAAGVNLAWGFTKLPTRSSAHFPVVTMDRRFPPIRALVFRGCANEVAFKTFARASMLAHQARFQAYNANMDDIQRASALREALVASPSPTSDDAIMRALES